VSLHQPHGVPRQIVIDDVAALLQVHALSQHVGANQDVEKVVIAGGSGVAGDRHEPEDGILAGNSAPAFLPRHRDDSPPVGCESLLAVHQLADVRFNPVGGIGKVREDDDLPLVP
jgi:hypothetical protein